jgi:PRC-barrel domain protein
MTAPIEDVGSLPGKTVSDHEMRKIGEIKDIYAVGGDENPMYVTVDASIGMSSSRTVFIPIARIKEEKGELLVPYSSDHLQDAPEIEAGDELSEDDDATLRGFYGIDRGDQEIRTDNASYANQVPEGDEPPRKVSNG